MMAQYLIRVSDAAFDYIKTAQTKNNIQSQHLRVFAKGGGCNGYIYEVKWDKERLNDFIVEKDNIKVLCDPKSLKIMDGLLLDYSVNLFNAGFKFINPNKKSCSCGISYG